MHVFKVARGDSADPPFELVRRECDIDELGDVMAISYAWGSLPHTEAFRFSDELAIKLGREWNHRRFIEELVILSQDAWLWLDQLSLRQNNATTKELNISIPAVFKQVRVLVLLPGRDCDERNKDLESTILDGNGDRRGLSRSTVVVERLVHHARECEQNCSGGIDVWLRKVWPWQEFAYARRIQIRFAAGTPRSSENNAVTNDVVTLLRQEVFDKNVRLQVLEEFEQTERFTHLLRGNEVEFGDFCEPTGQAMLHYMSNYVEQNRICTKDTDLDSAVAPAIYAKANAKVNLTEGVINLIQHIENETRTIFVGPRPCGIMDSSIGTLDAHPLTFRGLNGHSNVGKISFLHGTHFANDDLLANVDDSITVEPFLAEPDRYNGHEVRLFLAAMSLNQRRMVARWMSSWEPQPSIDGSGIFNKVIELLKSAFARSEVTSERSIILNFYREVTIPNPTLLVTFCLILLRVIESEASDFGYVIVSNCELVKITNNSNHLTTVGYQRKVADTPPRRLSAIVQETISSIHENAIEFVDLSGGHVDDTAAVALCDELESNTSTKALLLHDNRVGKRGMLAIGKMLQANSTLQAVHLPYVNNRASQWNTALDADQRVVRWSQSSQNNWRRLFVTNEYDNTMQVVSANVPVDVEAVLALGQVIKYRSIASLHLTKTAINERAMRALASGLKTNETIDAVELTENSIGEEEISALASALQVNTKVKVLRICGNRIPHIGARDLGVALKTNTAIKELDLIENDIDDDGAVALFDGLQHNVQIDSIDLRGNCIDDRGSQAIADAFMKRLKGFLFGMEKNRIGNDGARAFAQAWKMNTAPYLVNLGYNRIGDDGAIALVESLSTSDTLKSLDLRHNEIGDAGAEAIVQHLATNKTIEEIDLGDNRIGDDGARAFLQPIRATKTFKRLYLHGNGRIGAALQDELKKAVIESESVREVTTD